MLDTIMNMAWQDLVLGGGNIIFFIALIPSILSPHKPAIATSVMTASVLSIYSVTFFTLDLTFSMLGSALTALAWWTLAYQEFRKEHEEPTITTTESN